MITLQILDYKGNLVEEWHWDNKREIPNKGDTLLIQSDEYRVSVLHREFYSTKIDVIGIVTDYVELKKNENKTNCVDETVLP